MSEFHWSSPDQPLRNTLFLLLALMVCAGCDDTEQPLPPIDVPTMTPMMGGPASTPFFVAPQVDLRMLQASTLQIDPAEEVIGVIVDGTARCYLLRAMKNMNSHVVNENRCERPFCVTYCDRTDTVRVLAGSVGDLLEVQTAGFDDGQMLIMHSETLFGQNSDKIPLEDLSFERTTWADWTGAHPESLVFVGDQPAGAGAQQSKPEANGSINSGSLPDLPKESDPHG
jgi:hypothetical protein